MNAEVIVVGAGPAGAAAAYYLARAGRRVLLLERSRFPRDKSCGDGLTRFAARRLDEMGVLAALDGAQPACGVRVTMRGRGDRTFEYPRGLPPPDAGLVVPRYVLDEVVCRKAVEAGAELWEEALVSALVREEGTVTGVEVRRGNHRTILTAPVTVVAAGAASRLTSDLDFESAAAHKLGIAIRGYYTDIEGLSPFLEIYTPLLDATDRYLLPSYGWVFPTGPRTANVGVGLFERERGANVRELFQRFLDTLSREDVRFAGANACSPWKGAPLRFDFAPERCAAPGVVLVGDAAGLISPFTGEGIGYALESGKLAAEAIHEQLQAGHSGAADLSAYSRRLARAYAGYFETGRESARRYRLVWHLLESTFGNEQPLFVLCRHVALFPEGLGESLTDAALDDVGDRVDHTELPLQTDLMAVGELLIDSVRRDWPFLARALTVGQGSPRIPFRPALLLLLATYAGGHALAPLDRALTFRLAAAIELGVLSAVAHFSVENDEPAAVPEGDDGRPANWGNMTALLVGDFLLAKAHILAGTAGAKSSGMIADALGQACEGRASELRAAWDLRRSPDEHVEMLSRKTAVFFSLPCRIGAVAGGLAPAAVEALSHYGRALGIAYELTDEAMAAAGRPGKLARLLGPSVHQGIYGLPVLLAAQNNGGVAQDLRRLLAIPRTDAKTLAGVAPGNVRALSDYLRDSGAIELTLERAWAFSTEARAALAPLPDGPVRRSLENLAEYVVARAQPRSRPIPRFT